MSSAQNTIFALVVSSILALTAFLACSTEKPEVAGIQGHTTIFDGVPHANAASRGERYCHTCHGPALAGGKSAEPSCYQCHGKNWDDENASQSWASNDHTVSSGGFLHQPGLSVPDAQCSECHGGDLQGDVTGVNRLPGCYTCHGAIWLMTPAE